MSQLLELEKKIEIILFNSRFSRQNFVQINDLRTKKINLKLKLDNKKIDTLDNT